MATGFRIPWKQFLVFCIVRIYLEFRMYLISENCRVRLLGSGGLAVHAQRGNGFALLKCSVRKRAQEPASLLLQEGGVHGNIAVQMVGLVVHVVLIHWLEKRDRRAWVRQRLAQEAAAGAATEAPSGAEQQQQKKAA